MMAADECLYGISSNGSNVMWCRIHIAPFSRPHATRSPERNSALYFSPALVFFFFSRKYTRDLSISVCTFRRELQRCDGLRGLAMLRTSDVDDVLVGRLFLENRQEVRKRRRAFGRYQSARLVIVKAHSAPRVSHNQIIAVVIISLLHMCFSLNVRYLKLLFSILFYLSG